MVKSMTKLMKVKYLLLLFSLCYCPAQATQLDIEGSLQHNLSENELSFEKARIGIKEVLSDAKGDRVNLFLQLEGEDNFKETHIDQLYAKYKGPMGRWNLTLGRSLIPFGLLSDYDSEVLLLKTQEKKTIGYKSDDGVKLSGFWKSMDYELLLSPKKLLKNNHKDNNDKMLALKASFKGQDIEDLKLGFSLLSAEFQDIKKDMFAIDIIKYHDLLVTRNEVVFGRQEDDSLLSIFTGIDYSLAPSVDLNVAYTYYKADHKEESAFLGISYNSPFYGLVFRAGNTHYFKQKTKENQNELLIQVYNAYSHYF
ncbi:MAG: Unknown protein [uncultured Sulfurovum sp.]|uniref:Porin domain-containing protein n=1 Tax=uncultured Sulfurovum sp. TaxID=269237 RepID=A0A6S6TLH4_9BACT|nr:MAG: Unknown protein [uncultured Sulfurovum sp.]